MLVTSKQNFGFGLTQKKTTTKPMKIGTNDDDDDDDSDTHN